MQTADRYRRIADEYRARAKIMFQEDSSQDALLGIARVAEFAADALDRQEFAAPEPLRRTKVVDCETCGGSGQQAFGHPNDPSPREIVCEDCGGTGQDEVELHDIDEEDIA